MLLSWLDDAVIAGYLLGMLGFGVFWARRGRTEDEYFLVGRRMPWLVIGISVVASMLSSITYLAEPGEIWKSGITHVLGKMLGIPLAVVVVWIFCVPFMMRFRFTSAYEYLGHRFGRASQRLGALLFITVVFLWMGFVISVLSQVIHHLAGVPLWSVVFTVGTVATVYTMLGGLRAVIWTDVIQVGLLTAAAILTVGYIAWTTGSWLPDWLVVTRQFIASTGGSKSLPLFSWDPTVRATVVTVAINMAVWHVCMHTSNQMTVQRYFATKDVRAARRSFLASAVLSMGITLLLVAVGLAVLYFYVGTMTPIDGQLDPQRNRDLIFPMFAVHRLPVGAAGAILAALLAAAMSSIDSGLNSLATVVSVELRPAVADDSRAKAAKNTDSNSVRSAMVITALAGCVITLVALVLTFLPPTWGIVGAIPRTFNAVTGPLGGLFLVGMFCPFVGQRSAWVATGLGLAASVVMGYLQQIGAALEPWGLGRASWPELSFTWILPCSLLATIVTAPLLALVWRETPQFPNGLTWWSRHDGSTPCPWVN